MKKRLLLLPLAIIALNICQAQLVPLFERTTFPEITVDPIVNFKDTGVTFVSEWNNAAWLRAASEWGDGTFFTEMKYNWNAKGCGGDYTVYPEYTLFLLDAANDLDVRDLWDYASFEMITDGEVVTIWVFGNADHPQNQDWIWIPASGIGRPFIDDRQGYLVRYNNRASSDRQFFADTDPCPGDPAFNFSDSYGIFGHYNFNTTPYDYGLPNSVPWNHELYELCSIDVDGGYMLCHKGKMIDPCKPLPKGQKGNPNDAQKRAAAKICRDSVPYCPVPREGYTYTPMTDTTNLGFQLTNETDTTISFHVMFTSSLFSPIETEITSLDLAGHADTMLTAKVISHAMVGYKDTIVCWTNYRTAWTVIEGAGDLHRIDLLPDSLSLSIGDTVFLGGYGYDPDGRPLFLKHPVWTTTGGVGAIAGLINHKHVPAFMVVGQFIAQNAGSGYIYLENMNIFGTRIADSTYVTVVPLSVDKRKEQGVLLAQNFPNPFGNSTRIEFSLEKSMHAELRIYSVDGTCLRTMADGIFSGGFHSITWDGRNETGEKLSNGIYFYQLKTSDGEIRTRKMVLLD
ncbi:MAG: T9SS type A sorting domain-containing protein [Bacteroidetes bacterium]|nr:T9SS type A sorting domain-containing protein [Bacteroidota bacterium]